MPNQDRMCVPCLSHRVYKNKVAHASFFASFVMAISFISIGVLGYLVAVDDKDRKFALGTAGVGLAFSFIAGVAFFAGTKVQRSNDANEESGLLARARGPQNA